MELSKIQKEIVEASESKIVVHSSAGSGKTRCLTERLKYLIEHGADPYKIVAITFTNAAAEEISERLGNPAGLFIGTIHSYANQLLLSYGINTSDILENEKFDKLFSRVKKNIDCIKEVDYLLLDEGQDSAPKQYEFCLKTISPKNWMLFADVRQAIYRFAGAEPDYIIDLMHDPEVKVYNLLENYRNGRDILDFAKSMLAPLGLEYEDHSKPMRDTDGKIYQVDYSGSGIAKTISQRVTNGLDIYSDWFILTRTNAQSEKIMYDLQAAKIPCDTFKKANLDNKGLKKKMKENTVKVLTIHTAKGLEANNVVVIGAHFKDIEERCLCYVAATRARNILVWTRSPKRRKTTVTNWE